MTPQPDDRTNTRDTSGSASQQGDPNRSNRQGSQQHAQQEPAGAAGWFASATLRTGLIIVGFVLFLFALGQAVGFPLLDLFVEAVSSPTGRWIMVALFALLLIAAASRGLNRPIFGG